MTCPSQVATVSEAQEGTVADRIGPPRTGVGRQWTKLTQRHRAARWVDEWWYERANIPSFAISVSSEIGVYAIGLAAGFPGVLVVTTARLSAILNEFHTAYLAVRHRNLDLFNQPQTWERKADGSVERAAGAESMLTRRVRVEGTVVHRFKHHTRRHVSDLWTQRRRLPGFIISTSMPILGLVLGAAFHVPLIVTTALTYGTVALGTAPIIRSGVLALIHRSPGYLNKPQLHAPPERSGNGEPEAPAAELPDVSAAPASFTSPTPAARPAPRAAPVGAPPTLTRRPQTPDNGMSL